MMYDVQVCAYYGHLQRHHTVVLDPGGEVASSSADIPGFVTIFRIEVQQCQGYSE